MTMLESNCVITNIFILNDIINELKEKGGEA